MKLYRYTSLSDHTLKYLENMELYFQNPLYFNDPFECDLNCLDFEFGENFDKRFDNYVLILRNRLDYINIKIIEISCRLRDYASSDEKFRYYYATESNLLFREFNDLKEEISILEKVHYSKRKSALLDSWYTKKEKVINRIGVVCYTETNSNILMWSHYANSHKGLCFEFDSNQNPVKRWKNYKFHPINYSDSRKIDILEHGYVESFFKLLTTKSLHWEYEKEHRLITIKGSGCQPSPVDSIKSIIIGDKFKNNNGGYLLKFMDILYKLKERRNSSKQIKYYKAERDKHNFQLNIKELYGLEGLRKELF